MLLLLLNFVLVVVSVAIKVVNMMVVSMTILINLLILAVRLYCLAVGVEAHMQYDLDMLRHTIRDYLIDYNLLVVRRLKKSIVNVNKLLKKLQF